MSLTNNFNGDGASRNYIENDIDLFLEVLSILSTLIPEYVPEKDGKRYPSIEKDFFIKSSFFLTPERMKKISPLIAYIMKREVGGIQHQYENIHKNKGEWFFRNN
ncbi:hypothetical protein [Neobacillus sp. PS2-9]|uniref:hypothetical protein n=1 Tax=Neobacillus sp. PS2-9 TaxID=3070676 RepID=UPI0027DEF063|nr:hypothetical protein [Neobacillus sp. PS2-9]WML58600.1 hypothetical protein RCG25_02060 [Neobacillus sp. PS2-9]